MVLEKVILLLHTISYDNRPNPHNPVTDWRFPNARSLS